MSSFARRLLAGRLKTEVEKGQRCFPELFIDFGPGEAVRLDQEATKATRGMTGKWPVVVFLLGAIGPWS